MNYIPTNEIRYFTRILNNRPQARAHVLGEREHASIYGFVQFYQTEYGVLVSADISGLPVTPGPCGSNFYSFHIHEVGNCDSTPEEAYAYVKLHYNPHDCIHPHHTGDMPPLLENDGYAFMVFLTNRFSVEEVLGRTVLVHDAVDDFATQPSGNSGKKIACGIIIPLAQTTPLAIPPQ